MASESKVDCFEPVHLRKQSREGRQAETAGLKADPVREATGEDGREAGRQPTAMKLAARS